MYSSCIQVREKGCIAPEKRLPSLSMDAGYHACLSNGKPCLGYESIKIPFILYTMLLGFRFPVETGRDTKR